jgi:hypothetical protein
MSELEDFIALTDGETFLRIEDMVERMDRRGFWSAHWLDRAMESAKKARARSLRWCRWPRDADGRRLPRPEHLEPLPEEHRP